MDAVGPLHGATESDVRAGAELLRGTRELARGEHFLEAGMVADEFAIVASGVLREYFVLPDGLERTKAFVARGEPTGSLADLLSGGPSRAFITALESSRVMFGSWADLRALAARSMAWSRLQCDVLETMFVRKAEREYELIGLDAEARYTAFVVRYPELESRVAARHIASYLGITPEHLSRLRKRRRDRGEPR